MPAAPSETTPPPAPSAPPAATKRKKLSRRFLEWFAIHVGSLALRALAATWRVTLEGWEHVPAPDSKERVVYAFWHNRILGFVSSHRRRSVAVLVSKHGDGEIIARIIARFGFTTVRGSTTRGARAALKGLIGKAETVDVAVTPDGPRGPRYVLQAGVVLVASMTGRPVIYGSWSCSRAWRFRSWDRFIVPRPFARMTMRICPPVTIPPDLDDAGLEAARRDLEARLRRVTEELDREAGWEADPQLTASAADPAP